jgi:hypothetical protein
MRKPENLSGGMLGIEEYHRLSVAYGLSFLDIGEVITPDMISPIPLYNNHHNFTDAYVGSEMV